MYLSECSPRDRVARGKASSQEWGRSWEKDFRTVDHWLCIMQPAWTLASILETDQKRRMLQSKTAGKLTDEGRHILSLYS
jgi:hypothetical protein